MASRRYFDSTTAPSISPAFGSGWARTDEAVRRRLNTTRQSSVNTEGFQRTTTAGAVPAFVLAVQFVLEGLGAQTLTGTVKGQVRAITSSGALNATLAIRVATCDAAGDNVLEALAVVASDAGATTPPELSTLAFTNRRLLDATEATPLTLTDTSIPGGGALIVEIGYRTENNNVARNCRFAFGDDHATDLAEDDTTTTAHNPWVEFSMALAAVDPRLDWLGGTRVAGGVQRYQAIPSGLVPPGHGE